MLKKGLQVMLCIISIIAEVWFLIPLICCRIFSIGNGTGIMAFACLLIYAIKMESINIWIKDRLKTRSGKIIFGICGSIGVITIGLTIFFSVSMVKAVDKTVEGNATLVILGCKVRGESASITLIERLEAGYTYLTEHNEAACVLSGGKGPGEDISEAECMYRYLIDKGIQSERLYREDQSTSTRENLAFSKQIIEENNLSNNIIIATNEFHMYRAGEIAESLGLNWGAASGKTIWYLFPTYYVRELYANVNQMLFY